MTAGCAFLYSVPAAFKRELANHRGAELQNVELYALGVLEHQWAVGG